MPETLRTGESEPLGGVIRVIDNYNDDIAPHVTLDPNRLTVLARRDLGFDDRLADITTVELSNEGHGVVVQARSRFRKPSATIRIPVAEQLLLDTDYHNFLELYSKSTDELGSTSEVDLPGLRVVQAARLGYHIAIHLLEIPSIASSQLADRNERDVNAFLNAVIIAGLYSANFAPSLLQRTIGTSMFLGNLGLNHYYRHNIAVQDIETNKVISKIQEEKKLWNIITDPQKLTDWSTLCTIS